MVPSSDGESRLRRVSHAVTPLLVNLAIGLFLRAIMPYTLADSGERYRYYLMSLLFPLPQCPSFHCFRILPPLLTSLLPFEVVDAFLVTGFVFQVLAAVMVWLIAEHLHASRRVAAFAAGWYWVTWGPMQAFGDPLLITDPVAAFWSLTAMYLLLERRFVLALLVLVSGVTVKESVLLVAPIYAVYLFLVSVPPQRTRIWLLALVSSPVIAWLLLRTALTNWFGYVSSEDSDYVRVTYFFGYWLPNLGMFPRNLLIAALYIFGACGAAWVLGPLGLRHANRRQRALTIASLPAMVFLALYQVPDRALASFPYATLVPAALVLSRLPSALGIALLVASAAFSIRMNTTASWVPRMPITLAIIGALTIVVMWLDLRRRSPAAAVLDPICPARSRAALTAALAILTLFGLVSARAWRAYTGGAPITWAAGTSPRLEDDEGQTPALALSPDGQSVAFVASDAGGADGGTKRRLWRRRVGSSSAVALAGTDGANEPFWSPDGRSIGFFADRRLKTLDLASGTVRVLADAAIARGGAWSPHGVIVFAPDLTGGLSQVASSGGPVTAVTTLDEAHGEQSHRWPSFLPDGRRFVFAARARRQADSALYLADLRSPARERITGDVSNAIYAAPGFLLIARHDGLWMQPFDATRRQTFDGRYKLATAAYDVAARRGAFAASDRVVAFAGARPGPAADATSRLRWLDARGRPLGAEGPADTPRFVDLSRDARVSEIERVADEGIVTSRSPDGRVVLYQKRSRRRPHAKPSWNVWIQPIERGSDAVPLVDDGYNHTQAQFSPDGRWIAYTSDEDGADEIYVQPYPQTGDRWQASMDGGAQPRWRSADEIVYVAGNRFVRAVSIDTQHAFRAGRPRPLFEISLRPPDRDVRLFQYAIASDGARFLVNAADAPPESLPITIAPGWRAGQRFR